MNERFPGLLQRIALWTGAVLILFLVLSFIFRNPLFNHYLSQKISHFNKSYRAVLVIDKARFTGLSSLEIRGLSLKPATGDTLLQISNIYTSVSLWKLLVGRLSLTNLQLKGFSLTMTRRDSVTNYLFLLERGTPKSGRQDTNVVRNYASRVSRMMEAVFDKVPSTFKIEHLDIHFLTNGHSVDVHLDSLEIRDRAFRSGIMVREESAAGIWDIGGRIDPVRREAMISIRGHDGRKVSLPYIKYRWNGQVRFDSVLFSLAELPGKTGKSRIGGNAGIFGMEVEHARISSEPVSFATAAMDYTLNFGKDYMELDSSSSVRFNRLQFNPYIRYRPKPSKQITLFVHKTEFPAEDLFSSLPAGLFSNLSGIRVRGSLSFNLDFHVDLSRVDSLNFDCNLNRHRFSLLSYGNADLSKLNSSFEYTAYEHGLPMATFIVGPENPGFRTIDQIPLILRNCVLNSEDGAFYGHRGFLLEAFRDAIIENIKAKRFVRGGSTITMQLVKNVFLNRNKTIARKMEEALIVWLIENCGITGKDRMFEVYLNIIEWGPGVYGAQDAAGFYFGKDVSRLSYAEAIFLASVIPRPKNFKYAFEPGGEFRDYIKNYYRLMSEKMLRKEMITQQEFDNLVPHVELKGPAKLMLQSLNDSIPGGQSRVIPL